MIRLLKSMFRYKPAAPEPVREVGIAGQMGHSVKVLSLLPNSEATAVLCPESDTSAVLLAVTDKTDDSPSAEVESETIEPVVKPTEVLRETNASALDAPAVDPEAVVKAVAKAKAKAEAESRSAKAQRLYAVFKKAKGAEAKIKTAQALLDHKRAVKLGFSAMGLPANCNSLLMDIINPPRKSR